MQVHVNTAMLLAAGLGSRLKPFTDKHPKALAMVNNKTLLERNIMYLQSFGINNIVINVHHFAKQIIDSVLENKGWGSNITISDETDAVLETGGGLLKAQPYLENAENFILMNCDILTNLNVAQLIAFHIQQQAMATLAVTNRETSRYLLCNKQQQLVGWCNDSTNEIKLPVATPEMERTKVAFSGIHIINKDIFKWIPFKGKFSMIDLYLALCPNHKIQTFNHSNDILLDVGKPESLLKAAALFK